MLPLSQALPAVSPSKTYYFQRALLLLQPFLLAFLVSGRMIIQLRLLVLLPGQQSQAPAALFLEFVRHQVSVVVDVPTELEFSVA